MPSHHSHPTTPHRGSLWAGIWYAVTLGAWLVSWDMQPLSQAKAAELALVAILAELVSVAVRWKWMSRGGDGGLESRDQSAAELVWLCAWGGQANALGLVAMLSPSLASALPGLIVTALVEAYLVPKSPWTRKAIGPSAATLVPQDAAPSPAFDGSPIDLATIGASAFEESPTDESGASAFEADQRHWTRSTHEGHAETGERFLSGWVRFALAEDQKSLALTIGFSPAFPTVPDIELDQELESEESHCEASVEHATPAGMRVAIKRTATGAELVGKLLWHATEAEHASTLLSTRLP